MHSTSFKIHNTSWQPAWTEYNHNTSCTYWWHHWFCDHDLVLSSAYTAVFFLLFVLLTKVLWPVYNLSLQALKHYPFTRLTPAHGTPISCDLHLSLGAVLLLFDVVSLFPVDQVIANCVDFKTNPISESLYPAQVLSHPQLLPQCPCALKTRNAHKTGI